MNIFSKKMRLYTHKCMISSKCIDQLTAKIVKKMKI